jgi:hypothetical protein
MSLQRIDVDTRKTVAGWEANTVSATDQHTVGELLADSDASARGTFRDATFNDAPLRVRSWNLRTESAPELWAVLPSESDTPSWPNPMERPRVVGEAIGRCVIAGHWPARVTHRRTPKPDRRQPLSRAASGRARRSPCRAGNLGSGGQYPTPRPGVHTCRSFGEPQPSQSSEGRASRVSLANPQARGGRVLDTQLGGHRDSVWEAEVLITEERKSIMGEESSTPVWALRQRGSGDGVAQLESHPDPRADPEARSASSTLVFRLTRAGETPESDCRCRQSRAVIHRP